MTSSASCCASSLRLSHESSYRSGSESFIASALAHMTDIARIAEESARLDPSLGDLSLAILSKTRKTEDAEIHQFRLWPSTTFDDDVENQGTVPSASTGIGNVDLGAAGGRILEHLSIGNEENYGAEPNDLHHSLSRQVDRSSPERLPDSNLPRRLPPSSPSKLNAVEQGPQNRPFDVSGRDETEFIRSESSHDLEPFYVDDIYSAKCLSLLLDASGITTHPSCFRKRSFALLQAPVMRKALRSMLQELKRENPAANTSDLKYCSLIQTELQNRQVIFSALTLIRTNAGNHVTNDTVETTLSVRKPDRNRKEVNFAIFSALLQVDPGGICSNKLNEMARQGIRSSGCLSKPAKRCGGPDHCQELNISPLCEFYDEQNELIGCGEVYPSVSFFHGSQVPQDMVAIRCMSRKSMHSSARRNEVIGEASEPSLKLWKISNVSRYALMDAYGDVVGSAIFATHAVSEKGRKKGIGAGDLDVEEGAVLCDVKISASHSSDAYFFSEWYKFGSSIWREVEDPTLTDSPVPQTLGDLQNFVSVLWHQKHLRKLSLERPS